MRLRHRLGLLLMLVTLLGCQTRPTKVFEKKENRQKETQAVINEKTVILDARAPFLWSLAHPSGSLNLQWEDFTQREPPFEGRLENDLFFHARRLARLGIGPNSDILVLGRGPTGEGEEGRLAWTLRRMGLAHVRFAGLESVSWPSTKEEAPARPEVPVWKPTPDDTLEISREQALQVLQKSPTNLWLIDVRPATEYLKESDPFAKMGVHSQLINIPWTEFLSAKGELHASVKLKLQAVGLQPDDRIFVLDERGVRSAGSTLLLRDLGYSQATNWAGGYRELHWFKPGRSAH